MAARLRGLYCESLKCRGRSSIHCTTKEHHGRVSFRDEFIQFLKANGIEYDERFI